MVLCIPMTLAGCVINSRTMYNFCMDSLTKKWGLLFKALGISVILAIIRILFDILNLDTLALTTLVTAFIGGAIFTVAIIFTGTLTDYKESERIPGDLATSIRALYNECNFCRTDPALVTQAQGHIVGMLSVINNNFRENNWDIGKVYTAMDAVNRDLWTMADKNVAPPMIVKLRAEMTNVDRIVNRVKQISDTSFIPAAYSITELATAATILLLLFVRLELFEGILMVIVLSTLLIALILLIKDMDDPFEVGQPSYADVDLFLLWNLEEELKLKSAAPPRSS